MAAPTRHRGRVSFSGTQKPSSTVPEGIARRHARRAATARREGVRALLGTCSTGRTGDDRLQRRAYAGEARQGAGNVDLGRRAPRPAGSRKGALIKTGDRTYCFIGEWDFDAFDRRRPAADDRRSRQAARACSRISAAASA